MPAARPVPDAFPADGPDTDRLRFLVRYAVLAPSDHNTQPWRFVVPDGDEGMLELWADRARALPVADPEGRALVVSCGAALYYLRLAARHFGFAAEVERRPDPARPDLLARVRLGAPLPPSPDEERLFRAIPKRHTNRRPFHEGFVPFYLLGALAAAAEAEGAWLALVTEEAAKAALADLVEEADRHLLADPAFRAEQARWLHPAADPDRVGLPGTTFGLPTPLDFATPLVAAALGRLDLAGPYAAQDRARAEGPGVLAVLGTADDAPEAWLRAGEALAHVLLRAAAAGLSASFLNRPVEAPAFRRRLCALAGRPGHPHLLFRLGFGPEAPPTPRRDAEDVLDDGAA